jgi:hypothetical protein
VCESSKECKRTPPARLAIAGIVIVKSIAVRPGVRGSNLKRLVTETSDSALPSGVSSLGLPVRVEISRPPHDCTQHTEASRCLRRLATSRARDPYFPPVTAARGPPPAPPPPGQSTGRGRGGRAPDRARTGGGGRTRRPGGPRGAAQTAASPGRPVLRSRRPAAAASRSSSAARYRALFGSCVNDDRVIC